MNDVLYIYFFDMMYNFIVLPKTTCQERKFPSRSPFEEEGGRGRENLYCHLQRNISWHSEFQAQQVGAEKFTSEHSGYDYLA